MSDKTQTRDCPPWYRLGSADLLFAALAVIIFNGARTTMLDDPGLGWHLRNIDAMAAQGGWLTHDPFSGPRHGQPWLTNQWLGELPLWLGERWAGLEGIAAVTALTLAFLLRCLYRMLLRDGVPWPVAIVWTGLAGLGTSFSWVARPNVFTMLFVLVTARACVLLHEGRLSRPAALWLLPLFAVWANCHGGFVAGLAMLGAAFAVEAVSAVSGTFSTCPDRSTLETCSTGLGSAPAAGGLARARALYLGVLLAGAFLATLVNPYGARLYPWVLKLLSDSYFMNLNAEWASPNFHGAGLFRFELILLLLPVLLVASRYRPNAVEVVLCVIWLHLALNGFRYVPLFVLVAVPMLGRCTRQLPWLEGLVARAESGSPFVPRTGLAPWGWSVIVAVACLVAARGLEGRYAHHDPHYVPTAALDRLIALNDEHGAGTVIFHGFNWGGYLTWKGWPRLRTWIDDRNEVQGREHCEEFFRVQEGAPGWLEVLDRARVELVCIPPHEGLAERLAEANTWREVYRDAHAVIFQRDLSAAADVNGSGQRAAQTTRTKGTP